MRYLVIVESPSKCRKIEKYLNENDDLNIYEVIATMGHIIELTSLKNIDFENNFECTYDLIKEKKRNTDLIKKKIKEYDEVILACDADREGEGIAASICKMFKLDIFTTKRITFNEITESALIKAIKNPRTIDINMAQAQQARQVLDLLVGYKVSPMLWKYITKHAANSLSSGRCQSPALRIIYDNQMEINNMNEQKLYNTIGYFTYFNIPFELNKQFESKKDVTDFLEKSADFSHIYSCSKPVKKYKASPEPFTTSRIQQVSSNELHYSPKETMRLCQNLYEAGYITYMRTDSKTYSKDFIESAKEYIRRNYAEGEKYIHENIDRLITGLIQNNKTNSTPQKGNNNKDKKERTQDAHEAIRPTNISLYELPERVDPKERRMYKLIWETTLESCISSAVFYAITANISGYNNTTFSYTSEQIHFPGWLIVSKKYNEETKEYKYLQIIKQDEVISYKKIVSKVTIKGLKQHYTEARLVQLLEEKGIGRPSTFSSLVDKIQERNYVKKEDVKGRKIECTDYELVDGDIFEEDVERDFGNEKNKLVIQPLGIIVMEFLDKHFFSLFNYDYTKNMEDDLDKISKGDKVWHELCRECNTQIDTLIQGLQDEVKMEIKIDKENTYIVGKYGPVVKHVENVNGLEQISFKPVKKGIQIETGMKIEEIIDTSKTIQKNQHNLGKYEGDDVILKKGNYGLYITWGKNSKTLKDLGNRPIENVTFDEVKKYLEEGSNFIREISPNVSIRKGPKGDYLFYKTTKMKKPKFFDLKQFYVDTKEDYNSCDIRSLKTWIKDTHQIS
jgi:DNA topoisomerase-1